MTGFRPDFYNEDPILHSIEILAWAAPRTGFVLREALDQFRNEFVQYGDAGHEASERIRKLVKSEMVLVVTPGVISTWKAALKNWRDRDPKTMSEADLEKGPGITDDEVEKLEGMLVQIAESKGPGRKPRLYRVTQAGSKYVETRKEDLKRIQKGKK